MGSASTGQSARDTYPAHDSEMGSCSTGGIVTFADDLVDQDEPFQDFVIVHELLHPRIPTHGKLFKALMSAHAPGWQRLDEKRMSGRTVTCPANRQVDAARIVT